MRLNLVPFLLAGASLVQYAAASPLRVTVVASAADVSTNVSFGEIRPIPVIGSQVMQQGAGRHHQGCSQFREKALMLSNKFRAAFGLPLIEPFSHEQGAEALKPLPPLPMQELRPGEIRILPVGSPSPIQPTPIFWEGRHREHHGMMEHRHRHGSFLHRVHRALMTLGPWEGRAVAFVLGCGIGVLLRMFWVMAIVVARTIRGGDNTADIEVHDILVFEADAEDIVVPPPQYTDEKVALADPSDTEHETKA